MADFRSSHRRSLRVTTARWEEALHTQAWMSSEDTRYRHAAKTWSKRQAADSARPTRILVIASCLPLLLHQALSHRLFMCRNVPELMNELGIQKGLWVADLHIGKCCNRTRSSPAILHAACGVPETMACSEGECKRPKHNCMTRISIWSQNHLEAENSPKTCWVQKNTISTYTWTHASTQEEKSHHETILVFVLYSRGPGYTCNLSSGSLWRIRLSLSWKTKPQSLQHRVANVAPHTAEATKPRIVIPAP